MMTRIMIASKTRPGIDLESLVAKHEFLVVSKSMFTTDGMPPVCQFHATTNLCSCPH